MRTFGTSTLTVIFHKFDLRSDILDISNILQIGQKTEKSTDKCSDSVNRSNSTAGGVDFADDIY